MSIIAARDGLATQLNTIAGLRVYEFPPEAAPELPAAIILQGEPFASYGHSIGAPDVKLFFQALVLVRSGDGGQAWSELEPFLESTGVSSVKAAVDGTLGGSADWARVTRVIKAGPVIHNRASGEFLCLSYQVISRVNHLVKFEAHFKQDANITLGSWP